MGPIFKAPAWADFWSALVELLSNTAHWFLGSWLGNLVLIVTLLLVVALLTTTFGMRDPLTDPQPWED